MGETVVEMEPLVRDDLVNTAVKFLQNPKVLPSPLSHKQQFLKKKGLTDKEIQKACDIAGAVLPQIQNNYTTIAMPNKQMPMHIQQAYPGFLQNSLYIKIREIFNAAAIFGTTLYCMYWLYKRFIEPFLFGKPKKKQDPIEELDKKVEKSMTEFKDSIERVQTDIHRLTQQNLEHTLTQLSQEMKQDFSSLKSLMLSRKQFPSPPTSIPPSIPAWQLETSTQNREKTNEREDDAGSGSSTNNSDSSLEMIREDPSKE